ncbi:hypothetical protein RP20_CCG014346 [Aedes albopictus]|nr:hypothetical protein RP20_CCG014346 [Aedes albopictus]
MFNCEDLSAHCCTCLKPVMPDGTESSESGVPLDYVDPHSDMTVAAMLREVLLDSFYQKNGATVLQDVEGKVICRTCFKKIQDIRLFRSQCTEVYWFYETLTQAQNSRSEEQLLNHLKSSVKQSLQSHLFRLGITSCENLPAQTLLSEIGFIKPEIEYELIEEASLQDSDPEVESPKVELDHGSGESESSDDEETLASIQRKEQVLKGSQFTICPVSDCQQSLVGQRYTNHLQQFHRFGCKLCGLILPLKHTMIKHMQIHTPPQQLPTVQCTFCERTFSSTAKMRSHARDVHLQQATNYECEVCGEKFDKRKLLNHHRESHLQKECSLCDAQFDHPAKLLSHMKNLHPKQLFACNQCARKFLAQDALDRHLQQHAVIGSSEDSYQLLTLKCLSVFVCDQCEKQYTSEAHRSVHMVSHDPASRPKIVFKKRSKAELDKLEKTFRCDQCDASYRLRSSLEAHLKTHSATPFICDACGAFFKNKSYLRQHVTYKHSRNYRYFCEFCPKACATSSDLLRHRRVHTNERPYKCDQCDARFKAHDGYQKHMRSHAGEKIYRCDLCERSFMSHCSLKTHKIGHTNEKAYKCFHCEQCFNVPKNRRRHILRWHPGLPTKQPVDEKTAEGK